MKTRRRVTLFVAGKEGSRLVHPSLDGESTTTVHSRSSTTEIRNASQRNNRSVVSILGLDFPTIKKRGFSHDVQTRLGGGHDVSATFCHHRASLKRSSSVTP